MAKSREIIQLYVGQAGSQIASACWELFCLEHGIYADGSVMDPNDHDCDTNAFYDLYYCKPSQCYKCIPRVILVDSDPTPIDEIRNGVYKGLFDPCSMITWVEGAASNFARGYKEVANALLEKTIDRVRRIAEDCDCLDGFLTFRSISGGTGSGFGTVLLEKLQEEYGRKTRHEFDLFPSPKISSVILEPYNALLSTHIGMEVTDCCVLMDNESLYDVCSKNLQVNNSNYTNLNRIIAQVISSCTASLRFPGSINVDFMEFMTNLIPFPRIHFPIVSYAPIVPSKGCLADFSTAQITQALFHQNQQLVKTIGCNGKYICCCLLYRGDIQLTEINHTIQEIKAKKKECFVAWTPTSFKIGINYQPPTCVPGGNISAVNRAACMLSNKTSIRNAWQHLLTKFQELYRRKAFFHHYEQEDMEMDQFADAINSVMGLINDYEEFED